MGLSAMVGVDILHRVRRDRLALGVLAMAVLDQALPAFTTPPAVIHSQATHGRHDGALEPRAGCRARRPECCRVPDRIDASTLAARARPPGVTPTSGGENSVASVGYIARMAQDHVRLGRPASKDNAIDPDTYRCALADLRTLSDMGFAAVVLDHHAGPPDQLSPALTMLLGAPHYTDAMRRCGRYGDGWPRSHARCRLSVSVRVTRVGELVLVMMEDRVSDHQEDHRDDDGQDDGAGEETMVSINSWTTPTRCAIGLSCKTSLKRAG